MGGKFHRSTSSQGASPVRTSLQAVNGQVSIKAHGRASGSSSSALSKSCSRRGCLLRMSEGYSPAELRSSSRTWPRSGTMRNGRCYPQPSSVPRISVKEFLLWPTPTITGTANPLGSLLRAGETWQSTSNLTARLCGMEYLLQGRESYPVGRHYPAPEFIEWLMGVPKNWTDCDASETASFQPNPDTLQS